MDVVERGSSGWGRFPETSKGWVKVLGRDVGCLLADMGRAALKGRDVGTGDVVLGRN